jgi:pyrimidine-specific ribonucleoside hydrolase
MSVNLIHVTDLHHPPHDVDDLFDLAAVYGMPGADVKAVLLDHLGDVDPYQQMYEPGFLPVTQLNWLTAKPVPVAAGPSTRLKSADDDGSDYPAQEQSAIDLFLKVLKESDKPVAVTSVGSCRIIACAINRNPGLCKEKIASLHIVAGSVHYFNYDSGLDYNVKVDPLAYVKVFTSDIPICWYPCSAGHPYTEGETEKYKMYSSRWDYPQEKLSSGIDRRLHAWMVCNMSGNLRGDIIRALDERWYGGSWWAGIKRTIRMFWSTAAIVHAAGCKLVKTENGWRFVKAEEKQVGWTEAKLDLVPVSVKVTPAGYTSWKSVDKSRIKLYSREPGESHNNAMGEAMNMLLKNLVPDSEAYMQQDMSP